jgi:penicillin-binding protein 1A
MQEPTPESKPIETQAPSKPAKSAGYRLARKIFLGLTGFIGLVVLIFVLIAATDIPPLTEIENPQSDLSTQLISADGRVLGNFYSDENRVSVRLNQVSPLVIDALVATEDVRFYKHSGIDTRAIPSILYRNVIRGQRSGGSTISMQLTRNLYERVGKARTLTRKLKEAIVATIIERNFTKEEILIAYLNTVNIYGNSYGIETASQRLFDKSAQDLNLEEAALIVGILKGQGEYSPFRYPEKAMNRRNTVINQMVKYKFLDQAVADSVKQIPLSLKPGSFEHTGGVAPYFREHVRNNMRDWCAKHGFNLYTDGLRIYTTIDSRMQIHAEEAVREHLTELQTIFDKHITGREPFRRDESMLDELMQKSDRYKNGKKAGKTDLELRKEFSEPQPMRIFSWKGDIDTTMTPMDSVKYYARFLETGLVSIDPTNGQIKAWVGGINARYFQYEHVAQGKRQVGSTFKPFVYAAALDNGKKPCDLELNQPVFFDNPGGGRWAPKNADGSIGGLMTLRRGLARSVNLITARLMKQLGPKTVAEYAHKIGIQTELDEVPALCLGTTDLSVLELTGAYCTFANQGEWIEPNFITRIEDRNGNVIEEFIPDQHRALSEEKAYLMVELLKGVVDEPGGTAGSLRFRYGFNNEIGGKTGTTQNHSDGWFVGVTPNLVTGIWVGCADRRMRFRSIQYGQGARLALPIWAIYMKKVYNDPEIGFPQERFTRPPGFQAELNCPDPGSGTPQGFPGELPEDSAQTETFQNPGVLDGFE